MKRLQRRWGDIAQVAGLAKDTIYHYYNNKLSLLEEWLDDACCEAKKITGTVMAEDARPIIRLERYAPSISWEHV
jgi:AcrR family transcriptional regulator